MLPRSGVLHDLVGDEREPVADRARVEEAHRLLVGGLAEQALAVPEHDREDHEPQLVDEVVLSQGAGELIAGRDDDFSV